MGNTFREPGERPTVPVCEGCRAKSDAEALQFTPEGRQLCRKCLGRVQAADADRRTGMSPDTTFFGRLMIRNPALVVRLGIAAIAASVILLYVAGAALFDCGDTHQSH